jgi:hypothetical protein
VCQRRKMAGSINYERNNNTVLSLFSASGSFLGPATPISIPKNTWTTTTPLLLLRTYGRSYVLCTTTIVVATFVRVGLNLVGLVAIAPFRRRPIAFGRRLVRVLISPFVPVVSPILARSTVVGTTSEM